MAAGESARLEARAITKAFGETKALSGVSITAAPGSIHALVGENGAGKSTLLRILAGAMAPDGGTIAIDGVPYRPSSPMDARRAGVGMVHQELSVCPHLTVAENLFLGAEVTSFGLVKRAETARLAREALAAVTDARSPIDPGAMAGELSTAEQQLVEIARAIAGASGKLLILDEPTSSLGAADTERLFGVLRRLRDEGRTILYVSHFLDEVRALCDSYTVLRDGRTVGAGSMEGVTSATLVELMAGRSMGELFPKTARSPGEVALEIEGLAGLRKPRRASLKLRRGQVTGIAGLVGAGRTELLRIVFGLDPVKRGTIRVGAFVGAASPARRLSQGVGLLSEDRKREGLATTLSIAENLTLSTLDRLGSFGLVSGKKQDEVARRFIEKLSIKCQGPDQAVSGLSGGNQQKVALGRLLCHDVDVLLLDEPTRGVDVGSKAQIHGLIDEAAASGKAVLVVSSQLTELLGLCDEVAVMCRGELGPLRPVKGLDEQAILLEATGS